MEYKVYDERKKEVVLKLVRGRGDLAATLIACDSKGNIREKGELLSITKKGELVLHSGISEELGLVLDMQGRLSIHSALMSNRFYKAIDEVTDISELDEVNSVSELDEVTSVSELDEDPPAGVKDNKDNTGR